MSQIWLANHRMAPCLHQQGGHSCKEESYSCVWGAWLHLWGRGITQMCISWVPAKLSLGRWCSRVLPIPSDPLLFKPKVSKPSLVLNVPDYPSQNSHPTASLLVFLSVWFCQLNLKTGKESPSLSFPSH